MLVLTRRIGETIVIGGNIEVTLLGFSFGKARIGIKAPKEISVHRREIEDRILRGDPWEGKEAKKVWEE